MAGVYVHVPFCRSRCGYCDFYSVADSGIPIREFVRALDREIRRTTPLESLLVNTVYFGGGTPSLLRPDGCSAVLETVRSSFPVAADPEITLELNPATVDTDDWIRFRALGVNRLSIGVQSFDEEELRFLGRIHTAGDALRVLEEARNAGFGNIGIDLIFGLPGQGADTWNSTLRQAIALGPEHISCYALTYSSNTPTGRQIIAGRIPKPDEETVADLYLLAHESLSDAGYEHYEISNFAKPGRRCRHNETYWSGDPYLGFGPSAHSYIDGERSWNIRDVRQYIDVLSQHRLPRKGREVLNRDQRRIERLTLALRKIEGIPLSELGGGIDRIVDLIPRFGRIRGDRFQPTALGFLVADEIATELAA